MINLKNPTLVKGKLHMPGEVEFDEALERELLEAGLAEEYGPVSISCYRNDDDEAGGAADYDDASSGGDANADKEPAPEAVKSNDVQGRGGKRSK